MRSIEERYLRYADAVITVSDPIARYLRRFNPRTEIVYNCPRFSDVPKISKKEARRRLNLPEDGFIVSSVGTLRYDCRLDLLLDVADLTKQHNITYLVVGDGPAAAEFKRDATRMSDARLVLLPRVSRNVALTSILASDLTWAIYQNRPESFNPRMTLPWKFFESLACGVPLIVDAGTFRAELVKELKCGIVVENDDPADISLTILSLVNTHIYHNMSAKAKHASTSRSLGWEAMSARLVAVYSRLR
jgi:glycosyltransferase involved in cell wall biosynthesis